MTDGTRSPLTLPIAAMITAGTSLVLGVFLVINAGMSYAEEPSLWTELDGGRTREQVMATAVTRAALLMAAGIIAAVVLMAAHVGREIARRSEADRVARLPDPSAAGWLVGVGRVDCEVGPGGRRVRPDRLAS